MYIVIYEKKSKIYIFSLKTPMYPKCWINYVFGCLKTFILKLLNHTNICTKFGSFVNRKNILILNHPTSWGKLGNYNLVWTTHISLHYKTKI